MKKALVILLCISMLLSLAGCAEKGPKYKTVGDAMAEETGGGYKQWDEEQFIYAFEVNGVPMRVVAKSSPEIIEQIDALDFFDENYEEKFKEIVAPLEVTGCEDLSSKIISQKELDKLAGKSGQELMDAGFEVIGFGWGGGDESEFDLCKGLFEYHAVTDAPEGVDSEDFDGMEHFNEVTVKSINYVGLSFNSTDLTITE